MLFELNFIYNKIRNRRVALNYSQEYIAVKLNISQNAYSKLELGYTKITIERLFQMAKILGLQAKELLNPQFVAQREKN